MIIIDIETSGLNSQENGIWQIGAIELENHENAFFDEGKIDEIDLVQKGALLVTGKTEEQLRDSTKKTQKELLKKFFRWIETIELKIAVCQNPHFDMTFLETKAKKYGLEYPFHHRHLDLHSITQTIQFKTKKKFLIENNKSAMGLSKILKFAGIPDNRKMHNAIEDAKLTAECFSRIIYGKKLLKEYFYFDIPSYLIQNRDLQ